MSSDRSPLLTKARLTGCRPGARAGFTLPWEPVRSGLACMSEDRRRAGRPRSQRVRSQGGFTLIELLARIMHEVRKSAAVCSESG
jgi:hypothetical protein